MDNDTNDVDEAHADKVFSVLGWTLASIFVLLVVFITVGGWWMWQISHNPIVDIVLPTNFPHHPTMVSPLLVLTSRALSAVPPQAINTPAPLTPTPTFVKGQLHFFFAAAPIAESSTLGAVIFAKK